MIVRHKPVQFQERFQKQDQLNNLA